MAEKKKGLVPSDLYRLVMISDAAAEPKGRGWALTRTVMREETQEYESSVLYEIDGKRGEIRTGTRAGSAAFSSDGSKLYYLSNESGENQIRERDLKTGEDRSLTSMRWGVREYVPGKDGDLFFTAERDPETDESLLFRERSRGEKEAEEKDAPNHAVVVRDIVHKWDGEGYLTGRKTHVFRRNRDGKIVRLTEGEHNFRQISVSSDGKKLCFVSDAVKDPDRRPIDIHLWIWDPENGGQRLLIDGHLQVDAPIFAERDTKIAFRGMDGANGWETVNRMWYYDLAEDRAVLVTPESDFDYAPSDISDFRGPSRTGACDGGEEGGIYLLTSWKGDTFVSRVFSDGSVRFLTEQKTSVLSFALDESRRWLYDIESTPAVPCRLRRTDRKTGETAVLLDPNREFLETKKLSRPEPLEIRSFDGIPVSGWIMKPVDFEEGKSYPAVLEIHGGPGAMYSNSFMHEFQVLAAAGYAVAYFNPRGSSGYGQHFQSLIARRYGGNGGGDYEDLMTAADEVEKLPYIDPDHFYVTGGSYGGFMTNWIVGHTDRFRAAVAQRSISNWASMVGSSDYGFCEAELGHQCDFFEEPFELQRISPVSYVRNIRTPLLLLHSDHDYRCPLEQAEQLFTLLKLLDRTVEMKIFPGQSHGLSRSGRPALRIERLESILGWFARYS